MSHNSKSLFSVAKFSIEGVGQGADQPLAACSVPPHLPGSQTVPAFKSVLPFNVNPFSLMRSSFHDSHTSIQVSVPQNSVHVHNNLSPSTSVKLDSVPLVPSSSHASSLFTNPFLLRKKLNIQPEPVPTVEPFTGLSTLPTSQTVVQPTGTQFSNTSHISVSLTATSPFPATHKPRKPHPDRLLASNPLRPQVMAADRLYSDF